MKLSFCNCCKWSPLNRDILRLALPAIFNNITVPLLGLCDTAIAGHLGSAVYIGAMAVGSVLLNVIYWLCGFLRMGTSGLSAQAFGADDEHMARDILRKALIIGTVLALLALLFRNPLLSILLRMVSADIDISSTATLYFTICIWAAPAQLAIMAVSGWFIGRQNTVVPMIIAVGINIINIILSLLLVFIFGLGFRGIAFGTLCATWVGLAGAVFFVQRELKKMFNYERKNDRTRDTMVRTGKAVGWPRFFSVSGDLFFRSACIMGVTIAMTSFGARLGETTLAANAVIMQFFLFFSYFMDGFAFAAEAITGRALGARDEVAMKSGVRAIIGWGGAMALLFMLAYGSGAGTLTAFLTDVEEVREAVSEMRTWVVAMPPLTVMAFIFDGIFIGLSRTRPLLFTALGAAGVFFAIMAIAVNGMIPFTDGLLWTAFETYLLLRGILLGCVYVKLQMKSLTL